MNVVQACTEMVMPTGGNTEESIFPASEWEYKNRASNCKMAFGIVPRRNWITTEFGGHVGIIKFHNVSSLAYLQTYTCINIAVFIYGTGYPKGFEKVWEQHYLL